MRIVDFFWSRKIVRILIGLVVTGAVICPAAVNSISQDTLKHYLENGSPFDFILIDVRSPGEISAGIGNAECKPYNLQWPAQFKKECGIIPKNGPVIIYCQSGGRAAEAVRYLFTHGFTKAYNAGGMMTWTGPTVPASDYKPASLLPEPSMLGQESSR